MGRPTKITDPNGNFTTTEYASNQGYPIWIKTTNPAGHQQTTYFSNPSQGFPCPSIDCALVTFGRQIPAATDDANGNRTTYDYDPLGRLTAVRQPTEQAAGSPASRVFSYDIHPTKAEVPVIRTQQLQDTNGPGGAARYIDTWVIYDSLLRERQTHTLSPASGRVIVTDTDYEGRGLVSSANLPEAITATPGNAVLPAPAGDWANLTVNAYDELSRQTLGWFFADPDNDNDLDLERQTTTSYTHNAVEVTPPRGGKVLTVTDAYDRAVRVEEHDGSAYRPTVYGYDPADRLMTVTDPANNTITFTYDMAGRRTAMDDPDAGDWTYAYDPAGNQTRVTDALGVAVFTNYDNLNRPTQRRRDSPTTGQLLASWAYDAAGQKGLLDSATRVTPTGNWVTDVVGYDTRNRPTGRTLTVPAGIPGLTSTYTVSYPGSAACGDTSARKLGLSWANAACAFAPRVSTRWQGLWV